MAEEEVASAKPFPRLPLLTFYGRASRSEMFLVVLLAVVVSVTVAMAVNTIWPSVGTDHLAWALLFEGLILGVCIRRLHDRNRSGWWIIPMRLLPTFLLAFGIALGRVGGDKAIIWAIWPMLLSVPLSLWGLIELFVLPAGLGAQQYGPDPRFKR